MVSGYTRRVNIDLDPESFDALIRPLADLGGTFLAFDLDNKRWRYVNGQSAFVSAYTELRLPNEALTPGEWKAEPHGDGWHIVAESNGLRIRMATAHGMKGDDAYVMAASKRLLEIAHQYARECGDCAGTRIVKAEQGGDEPCVECAHIWAVIDQAEHRATAVNKTHT